MRWLEKTSPTTAPTAPANSRAAMSPVEISRPSRIAGTLASQLDRPNPLTKKIAKSALRHAVGLAVDRMARHPILARFTVTPM
jgi:hypothetical protein